MFSIQLAPATAPETRRTGLGRRLLAKTIGFLAGLTLIASVDALFLHHVLWKSVSDTFALHQPTMEHALRAAWTGITVR